MFTSIEKNVFASIRSAVELVLYVIEFLPFSARVPQKKKMLFPPKLCHKKRKKKYMKYLYEDCDVMFKRCQVTKAVINISFFNFC